MTNLKNKNITLCITGGIAAYKVPDLIREFQKEGANVKVMATKGSLNFVTPLTLEVISKNPVQTELFSTSDKGGVSHIEETDLTDLIVIAPATANIIGKISYGLADDLITTTVMAASSPVLICPAMNTRMFENSIVQENVEKLLKHGYNFLEPDSGDLACGHVGKGRLPEKEKIINACKSILTNKSLQNERVLITGGPTKEFIDPVRFLSNPSTGKMAYEIAKTSVLKGAKTTLITGADNVKELPGLEIIKVVSAEQMEKEVFKHFKDYTIVIMASAVSDYRHKNISEHKIKKSDEKETLLLERTTDILKKAGAEKKEGQILIGFALETENLIENAKKKLAQKNLDFIIANETSSFKGDSTKAYIIDSIVIENTENTEEKELPEMTKNELSEIILEKAKKLRLKQKTAQ